MSDTEVSVDQVEAWLRSLQDRLVATLEDVDGRQRFSRDSWKRAAGGGGDSRVLVDGGVFEQAGVGYSHVFGERLPPSASRARPELAERGFRAMGVSLVLHPRSPNIPTTHANFRFFVAELEGSAPVWLFGGGFDSVLPGARRRAALASHREGRVRALWRRRL